jgi:hypothetical protein
MKPENPLHLHNLSTTRGRTDTHGKIYGVLSLIKGCARVPINTLDPLIFMAQHPAWVRGAVLCALWKLQD